MRDSIRLFWWLGAFFLFIDFVYTGMHMYFEDIEIEWVGTVSFFLGACLSFMVAMYLGSINKRVMPLTADMEEAEIDEADPDMGSFVPWSWWPFVMSSFVGIMTVGLSIRHGTWLVIIGLMLTVISIVGFVYEQYRGRWVR